ncbi:unnamed protein product, partial [Gongylonema pulchrum]|uniref:Phosphotransferase n=1 Tax=Gongylonema pulchrum TaxID=637853 RepID=A0A183D4E7_9BILA
SIKWYLENISCNTRVQDIDVDVVALLNDTVGTLMACAFKENSCQMGVILGTGTNACYMEKLSNCPKFAKYGFDRDKYPKEMIINMEWGAFGDDGCLDCFRTKYDREVDEKSINPGLHLFEKMISGMYMGELVRLVLLELAKNKQKGLGDLRRALKILQEIGVDKMSDSDCVHVAYVCEVISRR